MGVLCSNGSCWGIIWAICHMEPIYNSTCLLSKAIELKRCQQCNVWHWQLANTRPEMRALVWDSWIWHGGSLVRAAMSWVTRLGASWAGQNVTTHRLLLLTTYGTEQGVPLKPCLKLSSVRPETPMHFLINTLHMVYLTNIGPVVDQHQINVWPTLGQH